MLAESCRIVVLVTVIQITIAEIYKIPLKDPTGYHNDVTDDNVRTKSNNVRSDVIYKIPLTYVRGKYVDVTVDDIRRVRRKRHVTNGNLEGKPGQGYYIEMQIGTPPQKLNVLVDTGSSNFAVGAAPHPFINTYFNISQSATFTPTGIDVYVPYTQGNWKGILGRDHTLITSLPNVSGVVANIACITSSKNFFINGSNWQGILGLAYADIARPDASVEPFFNSLMEQTGVADAFSMQLCGTVDTAVTTDVSMGGTMVIGGVDSSLYDEPVLYAMLRREWYYEVLLTDITVNQVSLGLNCKEYNFDKTIVDSGTTNLRVPSNVYKTLLQAIQASTLTPEAPPSGFWEGAEILCWTEGETPWSAFPDLTLSLVESVNTTFDLVIPPQQYLRAVPDADKETTPKDCYKIAIASSDSGTVLGAVIMEGFYVIFDRQYRRVGFARTTCRGRDHTVNLSRVLGPNYVNFNTSICISDPVKKKQSALITAAYVISALCGVIILLLVIWVMVCRWGRCRKRQQELVDGDKLVAADEIEQTT